MMEKKKTDTVEPVRSGERYILLDALRGLALFGIYRANFPEFSLYSFLKDEAATGMLTAGIERVVRYLQRVCVDKKFYTSFLLLFGIGFSVLISNGVQKQVNGFPLFYRRMAILLLIGFVHLMFIRSGDIQMLYALLGLSLPLFRNMSDKGRLATAAFFPLLALVMDRMIEVKGINLSASKNTEK